MIAADQIGARKLSASILQADSRTDAWYSAIPSIFSFDYKATALPPVLTALGATYTRNSVKNVVQDGALVQLAANQFGTSYDSVTGLYGYAAEPAATNLCTYSEGTVAQYGAGASNVADAAAFFGAAAAIGFVDNAALRNAYKPLTLTAAVIYTVSVYVKMDDGLAPVVGVNTTTGDFTIRSDNAVHTSAALVVDCGNGVYRVSSAQAAATGGASRNCGIAKSTTQSARGFKIERMQIETGSRATSYIATGAATASRAADVLSVPVANIPGFSSAAYTLFADVRADVVIPLGGFFVNVDDGSNNNRSFIFRSAANFVDTQVASGAVTQASVQQVSVGIGRIKAAFSCANNSFLRAVNGSTGTSDVSGVMPISPTNLFIGCNWSGNQFNGFIFRAGLVPAALTQAQINGMTS